MKLTVIALFLAVVGIPASLMAQSFNVEDANGQIIGPLASSDAVAQGVEIEVNFAGAVCLPDDTCEDPTWLVLPWSQDGFGYQVYSANGMYPSSMPQQTFYYAGDNCGGQPYMMIPASTTTEAKPYFVVGGDSNAGFAYWPTDTSSGQDGGSQAQNGNNLGIASEQSSLIAFYNPNYQDGDNQNPISYYDASICEPAWYQDSALFAPVGSIQIQPDGPGQIVGEWKAPFSLVEASATPTPDDPSPDPTPSPVATPGCLYGANFRGVCYPPPTPSPTPTPAKKKKKG